ncbi:MULTISPECIES: hypothetical protein [unclassified Saccharothrix]
MVVADMLDLDALLRAVDGISAELGWTPTYPNYREGVRAPRN